MSTHNILVKEQEYLLELCDLVVVEIPLGVLGIEQHGKVDLRRTGRNSKKLVIFFFSFEKCGFVLRGQVDQVRLSYQVKLQRVLVR